MKCISVQERMEGVKRVESRTETVLKKNSLHICYFSDVQYFGTQKLIFRVKQIQKLIFRLKQPEIYLQIQINPISWYSETYLQLQTKSYILVLRNLSLDSNKPQTRQQLYLDSDVHYCCCYYYYYSFFAFFTPVSGIAHHQELSIYFCPWLFLLSVFRCSPSLLPVLPDSRTRCS